MNCSHVFDFQKQDFCICKNNVAQLISFDDRKCAGFLERCCCDRKSREAFAQSFALWQQSTIEFTCHDHSITACSRHIYVWCCSSRTSRSCWITQSTQHHRRGCNNAKLQPNQTCVVETYVTHSGEVLKRIPFAGWTKWPV